MKNKELKCLLLALVIIALLVSCATPASAPPTASELLNLGERYLLELNYEQAVAQFLAVIEIEPMNARAYIGAAEAYLALGRTDDAIAVLERGYAATGDVGIAEMLAGLRERESAENSTMNPESATDRIPGYLPIVTLDNAQIELVAPLQPLLLAMDYTGMYQYVSTHEDFWSLCEDIPVLGGADANFTVAVWETSDGVWTLTNHSYNGFPCFEFVLFQGDGVAGTVALATLIASKDGYACNLDKHEYSNSIANGAYEYIWYQNNSNNEHLIIEKGTAQDGLRHGTSDAFSVSKSYPSGDESRGQSYIVFENGVLVAGDTDVNMDGTVYNLYMPYYPYR